MFFFFFFLKLLFPEKFEKYGYNKELSFYREQRVLHRKVLDVACEEQLKSDMDQCGPGEEYGLLRKLIRYLE